jgi:Protein of unknown function C-terminus (DUF2399)
MEVRSYLNGNGEAQLSQSALAVDFDDRFPTMGPANRYENVLYVEKEGFDTLLAAERIQDRFDIGLMSTKGTSVTASRELIDKLALSGVRVFVMHDFDVSGFSIFGTLGTSSRRYKFGNAVPMIEVGLRLKDVEALGLDPEPVDVKKRTPTGNIALSPSRFRESIADPLHPSNEHVSGPCLIARRLRYGFVPGPDFTRRGVSSLPSLEAARNASAAAMAPVPAPLPRIPLATLRSS